MAGFKPKQKVFMMGTVLSNKWKENLKAMTNKKWGQNTFMGGNIKYKSNLSMQQNTRKD